MSNLRTEELLSFQEYSPVHSNHGREGSARLDVEAVHTAGLTAPASGDLGDLMRDMQGSRFMADDEAPTPAAAKNHNFWTIEYYQKYFDVNTDDVIQRVMASVVPRKASPTYFDDTIRSKPDMYGPFWISTTLIFTIAISGNVSNYLQHANTSYHWKYDFHLVSYAATAIFCYTWLVPMALWGALKLTMDDAAAQIAAEEDRPVTPSMMSLFCLYGYSLSIYIPVSILWTIQVAWLQWLLVLTAAMLSGLVLVYLLLPALKRSKNSLALMGCILGFHFLLAAGFMLYFFHVPAAVPIHNAVPIQNSVSSPATINEGR